MSAHTRVEVDRIFGDHEAEAMFEAIGNALAMLGSAGAVCSCFLDELQAERTHLLLELKCERDGKC